MSKLQIFSAKSYSILDFSTCSSNGTTSHPAQSHGVTFVLSISFISYILFSLPSIPSLLEFIFFINGNNPGLGHHYLLRRLLSWPPKFPVFSNLEYNSSLIFIISRYNAFSLPFQLTKFYSSFNACLRSP